MANSFVGATTGATLGTALPGGLVEFDVVWALLSTETMAASLTAATGWTLVDSDSDVNGSGVVKTWVYEIQVGAAPPATNWTLSGGVVSYLALRGVKRTGSWHNQPYQFTETSAGTYNISGQTTTVAGVWKVVLSGTYNWGAASSSTMANEAFDGGGSGPHAGYYEDAGAAGPTGTETISHGGGITRGVLMFIEPDPGTPAAPTITSVSAGHERGAAQWTAGSDGGSAVTGWDIDAATAAAPTTWFGPQSTGTTDLYGAYTGLTNGTAYVFRVRAVNANGAGAWSTTSSSATPSDRRGYLLLESGDKALLESGDRILLEAGAPPTSGVTGTIAVTDDADVVAAAGQSTHVGTIAVTDTGDTVAASGASTHVGTIAVTDTDDAVNAAGASTHVGTLAVTDDADVVNAAGSSTHVGQLAVTDTDDTVAGTGYTPNDGPLAVVDVDDVVAAAGTVTRLGTIAVTDDADVVTASGSTGFGGIIGTLAVVDADDTVAAAGTITRLGTIAVTDTDDTVAAAGYLPNDGPLAVVDADDVVAAAGHITRLAALALVDADDIINAAGSSTHVGTLAVTDDADAVFAGGSSTHVGTVALVDVDDIVAATGRPTRTGTIAIIDDPDVVVGISAGPAPNLTGIRDTRPRTYARTTRPFAFERTTAPVANDRRTSP